MAEYRVPTTQKVLSLLNNRGNYGKVLAIQTEPPNSPSSGDRYIVGVGAIGDWSGHDDEIAEYNGSGWEYKTSSEGIYVYVLAIDNYRFFVNSEWRNIDYLSDISEELANDGIHFKKSRYGFNTSILSSVFNIETSENNVDLFDIRKVSTDGDKYQRTATFNDGGMDGNCYVVNDSYAFRIDNNKVISRFDSDHNYDWSKQITISDVDDSDFGIKGAIILSDGLIIDTAPYSSSSGGDLGLYKVDFNGTVQWAKRYVASGNQYAAKISISSDNSGYVYVLFGNGNEILGIAKFDSDGNFVLAKTYTNSNIDKWNPTEENQIVSVPIGDYVYIAMLPHFSSGYRLVVLKIKKDDLSVVWAKKYSDSIESRGYSIAYDNGYLIVVGRTDDGSLILKLDTDGNIIDYSCDNFSGSQIADNFNYRQITVVSDGYIVTGDWLNIVAVKYDKDLNLVKSYYNTSRTAWGGTTFNDKLYIAGQNGYDVLVNRDLDLFSKDTEYEEITGIQNTTTSFAVSNLTMVESSLSLTESNANYNVDNYSATLQIIAQDNTTAPTDVTHFALLDSEGNLKITKALKLGNTSINEDGAIKYDDTADDIKGYIAGTWKSFTKNGKYIAETDEVEFDVE